MLTVVAQVQMASTRVLFVLPAYSICEADDIDRVWPGSDESMKVFIVEKKAERCLKKRRSVSLEAVGQEGDTIPYSAVSFVFYSNFVNNASSRAVRKIPIRHGLILQPFGSHNFIKDSWSSW